MAAHSHRLTASRNLWGCGYPRPELNDLFERTGGGTLHIGSIAAPVDDDSRCELPTVK